MKKEYRLVINVEEVNYDSEDVITHYASVRILSRYRKFPFEAALDFTKIIDYIVEKGNNSLPCGLLDKMIDNLSSYRNEYEERWS